jgi:hypothetical protein
MASITDAATVTSELSELAAELHSELSEGDADFDRMVELADSISQQADGLAATFSAVNDALEQGLDGGGRSEQG